MPPVRTTTASPLQVPGSTGPRASAPSFGSSASGLARGLSTVPGMLGGMAEGRMRSQAEAAEFAREEALEAKGEYEGEQRLRSREAAADLERGISEWNKENIDKSSPEEARKAYESLVDKAAQSRELDADFTRAFRATTLAGVNSAVDSFRAEARQRAQQDAILRIGQVSNSVIQDYLGDGPKGGNIAVLYAENVQLHEMTERRLPGNPVAVEKAKEKVDTDFAEALLGTDPEEAVKFINASPHIDAGKRNSLLKLAESSGKQMDFAERQKRDRTEQMHYRNALMGVTVVPLDESSYERKDQHQAYLNNLKIHSDASLIIAENSGVNRAKLNSLSASMASMDGEQNASMKLALEQLERQASLIETDPARYALSYNKNIKALQSSAAQARAAFAEDPSNSTLKQSWMDAQDDLNDELLRVQGYGDGETFLGKSAHERSLVPVPIAKDIAATIKQAKPADVVDKWNEFAAEYPDAEHQWIAFEDVAAQGLNFAEIASFYYRDEPWVDTFIESQRVSDQSKKVLSENDRAKFRQVLMDDPMFIAFTQANLDGGSNLNHVASTAEATLNYAERISIGENLSMEEAMQVATGNMFGSAMFIDSGNGVLQLNGFKGDGTPLTEWEVDSLENFVPKAINHLDLSQVGDHQFKTIAGNFDAESKKEFINTVISTGGNVRLGVDRDQMSIVIFGKMQAGGREFILEDKEGNPFRLHLNDLPRRSQGVETRSSKMPGHSNWPFREWVPGEVFEQMEDARQFEMVF